MSTEYITMPVKYNFNNKDAKGIIEIIPDAFGISIFVDGKQVSYIDLFYKAGGKDTVVEQFNPSSEEIENGFIVKPMDSDYYHDKTICRIIPIDKV